MTAGAPVTVQSIKTGNSAVGGGGGAGGGGGVGGGSRGRLS